VEQNFATDRPERRPFFRSKTETLDERNEGKMEGWIKLHRKIANWQWASSPNHMTLFMQLLLRANHKSTKWRAETIEPGQVLTGRKQLMEWTGLSEMQVRKCLDDLERTSEIIRKRSAKYSVITIANWKTYQSDNRETSVQQPANNQQTTTSNNDNNANNEKNNIFKASPLSFLFNHMPQVQNWLNEGNHDTHQILIQKYPENILQAEIVNMYEWATRNSMRAENWMYKRLNNIDIKPSNRPQKSFSRKTNGVTATPDNPTGNPYKAELFEKYGN
jgi:hypothetical protein